MASTSPRVEGAELGGKFKVIRCLGRGGMGAVYEVEHLITKHRRALKILRMEIADAPMVARLVREASAAGTIGNPHIVETFDAGELESGAPYIVMELLTGETLGQRLRRDRLVPFRELATLVSQACEAVQAAHDAGIVHRDLKPDNLFLQQRPDGAPFVKVLDFGVAKFGGNGEGNDLTIDGEIIGTPSYMAPEQIANPRDLDGRIDIYALGVIMYTALAGAKPFVSDSFPSLALKITSGTYPPLEQTRPDLPPELVHVVRTAMAVQREARYPRARDLADALRPFCDDHGGDAATLVVPSAPPASAPSARPSGALPPVQEARSRTRVGALPILLLVIGAGLLAMLGLFFAVRERGPGPAQALATSSAPLRSVVVPTPPRADPVTVPTGGPEAPALASSVSASLPGLEPSSRPPVAAGARASTRAVPSAPASALPLKRDNPYE